MKLILLFWFALLSCVSGLTQTFNRAEYFFDVDPGQGNGTSISLGPSGTTISFTTSISVASLAAGFHNLGVRIQQADDVWGLSETRGFYISQAAAASANITGAEYFFDSDPGQGNGTSVPVPTGATVNFTVPISVASLSTGFHFLTIRVKSSGLWSNFETRGFYVSTSTTAAGNITAAEYFFDSDPGQGNGTAIPVAAGATTNFTVSLPTAGLSEGFHFLAIRTKSAGLWGNFEIRGFYISSSTNSAPDITGAEYFFDTDPGVGSGIPLSIPSGSTSNFTVSLPANGLAPGFHLLAVRIKGADDKWGIFETRNFYVTAVIGNAADIVTAEYYIDNDPGIGSGTALPVSPTGAVINQNFAISLPVSLPAGVHTLAIRVMDSAGSWSEHEIVTFEISVNVPPVAVAGVDQTITLPTDGVILDGSSSADSDGTISSFSWTQVSGPSVASIADPNQSVTTVGDLTEGLYEFQLQVTDNGTFSDTDLITVTVNPEPNDSPIADAGPDQVIILPTNSVSLSGIASVDPDGTIASYAWVKLSGPSSFNIVNPDQVTTDVTNMAEGQYQFQLTVTDNRGALQSDIVLVTVNETGCPPTPVITQSDNLLICNPPGDSYKWFRNGEQIAGEANQILEISFIDYGIYTVELTDNGCTSSSTEFSYLITETENDAPVSDIYPNPVYSVLNVTVHANLENRRLTMIDVLGRKAMEKDLSFGANEINMSDLSPGMYYLIIDGKSYFKIQKL